jgi:carbon-monoxide dehydrogenase medium subunit
MLYNLREIHNPTDLSEAVMLLHRKDVQTAALAGGTWLAGQNRPDIEAVVSLDGLGLDGIERYGHVLRLGAMVRLQTIATDLGGVAGGLLSDASRRTAVWQVRNAATLGGTLCTADSAAPLVVVMAALGGRVYILAEDGGEPLRVELPQFILGRDSLLEEGGLLTAVDLRLAGEEVGFGYAQVARTPADDPIVSAAARVGRGMTEVFVGGVDVTVRRFSAQGDDPDVLVDQLSAKARDSSLNPPDDFLGSAEYRREMAGVLARRALVEAYARVGVEVG